MKAEEKTGCPRTPSQTQLESIPPNQQHSDPYLPTPADLNSKLAPLETEGNFCPPAASRTNHCQPTAAQNAAGLLSFHTGSSTSSEQQRLSASTPDQGGGVTAALLTAPTTSSPPHSTTSAFQCRARGHPAGAAVAMAQ